MPPDNKSSKRTVNVPPKFNREGRYQFWFVEGVPQEQLVNGMITGLLFALVALTAVEVLESTR